MNRRNFIGISSLAAVLSVMGIGATQSRAHGHPKAGLWVSKSFGRWTWLGNADVIRVNEFHEGGRAVMMEIGIPVADHVLEAGGLAPGDFTLVVQGDDGQFLYKFFDATPTWSMEDFPGGWPILLTLESQRFSFEKVSSRVSPFGGLA